MIIMYCSMHHLTSMKLTTCISCIRLHKEMVELCEWCTGSGPQIGINLIIKHSNTSIRSLDELFILCFLTWFWHLKYHRISILNTAIGNPLKISRAVGDALGVSHVFVLKTLHYDRMHPDHLMSIIPTSGVMMTYMTH